MSVTTERPCTLERLRQLAWDVRRATTSLYDMRLVGGGRVRPNLIQASRAAHLAEQELDLAVLNYERALAEHEVEEGVVCP